MASREITSPDSRHGFTLLETLVALAIATLLIATLIPVSRNTMFRIATISEQATSLALMENAIASENTNGNDQIAEGGIALRMVKKPLPSFSYPRGQRDQWQPVLVTIEARGQTGSITRIELIKLERATP